MRRYRLWTVNFNGTVSILSDWQTRGQCLRQIIGRWRHWPPWAYISTIKTADAFKARYARDLL